MSYEYVYVPKNKERAFPQEAMKAMQAWLTKLPIYVWEDGSYLLFGSSEDRAVSLPWLQQNPHKNDYLTASIHIEPKEIVISSVMECATDRMFYDFLIWCQQHWPGELRSQEYGEELLSPEELLIEP